MACTLGSGAGRDQLRRWQALDASHLVGRTRGPEDLVLLYRADEASRRELRELVDIEQDCCAYVTWILTDRSDTLTLRVRGAAADLDALSPA